MHHTGWIHRDTTTVVWQAQLLETPYNSAATTARIGWTDLCISPKVFSSAGEIFSSKWSMAMKEMSRNSRNTSCVRSWCSPTRSLCVLFKSILVSLRFVQINIRYDFQYMKHLVDNLCGRNTKKNKNSYQFWHCRFTKQKKKAKRNRCALPGMQQQKIDFDELTAWTNGSRCMCRCGCQRVEPTDDSCEKNHNTQSQLFA